MKPRITILGSTNTDMIVRLPSLPGRGETVIGGTFAMAAGGKGANQAVAAARAGGSVTFLSRVGNDTFGEHALRNFDREGLVISHLWRDERHASGVALILVDQSGENMIGVASGANAQILPADLEEARDAISSADMFLTQLEIPLQTVEAGLTMAHRAGVPVILNPAPARVLLPSTVSRVSVLTPNESEASAMTGIPIHDEASTRRAGEALRGMGAASVVITLGSRGALVADASHAEFLPAFDVEAIDATAAGDVFNGALAVALAEKATLREAALFASAAAALSVTVLGAQPSIPHRSDIENMLKKV